MEDCTLCRIIVCIIIYAAFFWWWKTIDYTLPIYVDVHLGHNYTKIFHLFKIDSFVILIGGYVSENYLGCYRTTVYGCLISVFGIVLMTVSQLKSLKLPSYPFYLISYEFIRFGRLFSIASVICLGPEQIEYPIRNYYVRMYMFLLWFVHNVTKYACIVFASTVEEKIVSVLDSSMFIIFYTATALSIITFLFLLVIGKFLRRPANSHYYFLREAYYCMMFARMEKKQVNPDERQCTHWLDYSVELYGAQFVMHVRRLHCMLIVVPLIFIFGQYQTLNSWHNMMPHLAIVYKGRQLREYDLTLINGGYVTFIWLGSSIVFILLSDRLWILGTALRRIMLSLILLLIFVAAMGIYSYYLDKSVLRPPGNKKAHFRIYNAANCSIYLNTSFVSHKIDVSQLIEPRSMFVETSVAVDDIASFPYKFTCDSLFSGEGIFSIENMEQKSYYLNHYGLMRSFTDDCSRQRKVTKFRQIVWTSKEINIVYKFSTGHVEKFTQDEIRQCVTDHDYAEVYVNNKKLGPCLFKNGGVYMVLITDNGGDSYDYKVVPINNPKIISLSGCMGMTTIIIFGETLLLGSVTSFVYINAPPGAKRFAISVFYFIFFVSRESIFSFDANLYFKSIVYILCTLSGIVLFIILSIWFDYLDTSDDCDPHSVEYDGKIFMPFY